MLTVRFTLFMWRSCMMFNRLVINLPFRDNLQEFWRKILKAWNSPSLTSLLPLTPEFDTFLHLSEAEGKICYTMDKCVCVYVCLRIIITYCSQCSYEVGRSFRFRIFHHVVVLKKIWVLLENLLEEVEMRLQAYVCAQMREGTEECSNSDEYFPISDYEYWKTLSFWQIMNWQIKLRTRRRGSWRRHRADG